MRLDSVRELKAALTGTLLAPLATVGVAPRPRNDFRLAVRVQRRAMEQSRELEAIQRQARAEVDVRYVGQVVKRAGAKRARASVRLTADSTAGAIGSARSGVTGIGTATDGKLAETQPRALDDDDRSTPKGLLDGRQARGDNGDLFRGALRRLSPEENDRGRCRFTQRQQRAEVRVSRDDHPRFECSTLEGRFVRGGLHAVVEDVNGVVTRSAESVRNRG
jgi:hypothetical protein